jgi:predicted ester cyclase
MENHGYPFARFQLDSLIIEGDRVSGQWIIDKGPHYKIDSLTVTGTAKISVTICNNTWKYPMGLIIEKISLTISVGVSRKYLF